VLVSGKKKSLHTLAALRWLHHQPSAMSETVSRAPPTCFLPQFIRLHLCNRSAPQSGRIGTLVGRIYGCLHGNHSILPAELSGKDTVPWLWEEAQGWALSPGSGMGLSLAFLQREKLSGKAGTQFYTAEGKPWLLLHAKHRYVRSTKEPNICCCQ